MSDDKVAKPTSRLTVLFYLILAAILLTVFLEGTGIADVAGKKEREEIIHQPHQ